MSKEILEQAKNEIAKEYGYESFEQFDDKSTFGYDHRTPEIIQRIAERYHSLMSEWIKPLLVKFVDTEKEYPVSYTIDQSGNKKHEPVFLKGKDLTENQIFEVFKNGLL